MYQEILQNALVVYRKLKAAKELVKKLEKDLAPDKERLDQTQIEVSIFS